MKSPKLTTQQIKNILCEIIMKRIRFTLRTIFLLILSVILINLSMFGQTVKPDSARTILKAAVTEAQSSKKNVLLIFHATWCSWCKRLETAFNDTPMKTFIDGNYIVMKLDVMERGDKIQSHENPGGQNLLSDFGGDNAGLPFIVFLNGKGEMIANSNVLPKKQNIGYPGSKEEIAAFVKLLKETAPHMTGKQRDRIQNYFELHAPQ
jgi:thiol:disulfide interchange protein